MGAAIAHSLTNIVAAVFMTLMIKFIPGIVEPESFHFFNEDSFKGWKEYLNLGFPSMMITTLQWAAVEAMGMYSGILGVDQLGAHTALANIHAFLHMVPLGMSFGSGALVGNSLGKGLHNMAKKYAFVSFYAAVASGVTECIILLVFSNYIFRVYTQDESMLTIMRNVLYAMCLVELNSNLSGILKGLIKAMGRQSELAWYAFAINAVLANIVALIIGFYFEMGLPGIWLGMGLAWSIASIIFTYKIFIADWYGETLKTLERLSIDKKSLNS